MSLINRMLKDLSTREPASGNVMSGIQVPASMQPARPAVLPRLGAMLILVTVFTAGLWWLFGPRNIPIPTPRAALNAGLTRTATPPASTPPASAGDIAVASAPVSPAELPPAPDTGPVESAAPAPLSEPVATGTQAVATSEATTPAGASTDAAQNASAPMTAAAYYAQGRRAQDSDDLAAAEYNYIEALKLNPRTHIAREALIGLRLDQNRLEDATRSLEKGLGYAPRRAEFLQLQQRLLAAGGSIKPPAAIQPAPVAASEAKPAAASVAELAPAAAPSPPAPPPAASGISRHAPAPAVAPATDDHAAREAQALRLIAAGRLTEAAEIVSQGLEREPAWSGYRRLAARIELARNQPKTALAALETDPPPLALDPEYHGLLASAYQRLGRHQDAARVYQGLTQSQPGEAHWWAGYAISRDSLGESAEALKAYAQARKLGQLDARVLEYIDRRVAALRDDK